MSAFVIYVAMMTFSPGANSFIQMENASRYGVKKAFRYTIGLVIAFFLMTAIAAVASAALYTKIPKIQPFLLVAGAIYLLYLAWGILKSGDGEERNSKIDMCSITNGFLVQFLNPQVIICVLTAMASFVLPNTDSIPVIAGSVVAVAIIAGLASTTWSIAGAAIQRIMNKYRKQSNVVMAVLLVYCAWTLVRQLWA